MKRLKTKIEEQDRLLSMKAEKDREQAELQETVKSLKNENMQSDGKIRELQTELVSLYAKSPEVGIFFLHMRQSLF